MSLKISIYSNTLGVRDWGWSKGSQRNVMIVYKRWRDRNEFFASDFTVKYEKHAIKLELLFGGEVSEELSQSRAVNDKVLGLFLKKIKTRCRWHTAKGF